MRVAVTGASGNAGTSLLAELAKAPEVDSIAGIARRIPAVAMPKVEWVQADVAADDLAKPFSSADAVVHLAWVIQPSRDPELLNHVNVEGSRRVFEAAAEAEVGTIVYASSVGTYAAVPPEEAEVRVDESHPSTGIETSIYSTQKAAVERILDGFERTHSEIAVSRLRPALIFKREAASEIRRYFAGPFFPNAILRLVRPPLVPLPAGLRMQCVHADDVGRAYALAVLNRARGAFNIAAEPQLDAADVARALGGKPVEVDPRPLRGLTRATWRARLQPTPEGWLDMGMGAPAMDTTRAREELGWSERVSADAALAELIQGLADGAGGATPPLHPRAGGRFRMRELRTGVGARP